MESLGEVATPKPPALDRSYSREVTASARAHGRKFAKEAVAADGVLQLDATARHLVHETFTCDTRDHEDHTFCGVMFDVSCETEFPTEYIELQSVFVRGALGPMTVWWTRGGYEDNYDEEDAWTQVYSGRHDSSWNSYAELKLSGLVRLRPGETCGIYIHSGLRGDAGLVYDNQRKDITYEDGVFKVFPGLAHLSNRPFGKSGMWGMPWRTGREFVGRIQYGARWKMWRPTEVQPPTIHTPRLMLSPPLPLSRPRVTLALPRAGGRRWCTTRSRMASDARCSHCC